MKPFAARWQAEILAGPPLISPARNFVWPQAISGEEDALARGAVYVSVRSEPAGHFPSYLLQCALGFKDPSMPTEVRACPNPDQLCVLAGGYAYLALASRPEQVTLLTMKPVVSVFPAPEAALLLFVGFQTVLAWGRNGSMWESQRLSWEGVRLQSIEGASVIGFGWDLMADEEVEFRLDLKTGEHTGGGFREVQRKV